MLSGFATNDVNDWMKQVVVFTKEGYCFKGEYDGYGRVSPTPIDVNDYFLDIDKRNSIWDGEDPPCCWHRSCFLMSGGSRKYQPSLSAPDQGYFFKKGAHDEPNPWPDDGPYFSTWSGLVGLGKWRTEYLPLAEFGPHGFRVNLPNGNTVSAQWGPMNYCQNRHGSMHEPQDFEAESRQYVCVNAEIAAWREAREGETPYTPHDSTVWHSFESRDQVKGWVSPEEALEFIDFAASNELDVRKWSYDYDLDEYVLVGNCPTLGKEGK